MQTKQQIPPIQDRKLPEGLTWRYDPEINEWVMAVRPVKPAPIRSADEYFSLDLNNLSKTVCPNAMRMDRVTCDRVKHLFSLSNLKKEAVTEHCLDNGDVMLCLPISIEDMVILAENEQ